MKTPKKAKPFFPSRSDLWVQLCMADEGSSVEIYRTKEDEKIAARLRWCGLITGRRWAKLTKHGMRVRNAISA
jgi:hypothetical protein